MSILSAGQLQDYQTHGFVVLRKVIDAVTLARLLAESHRLWTTQDIAETNQRIQWRKRCDGTKTADRIDPVLDISPLYLAFAKDERVTGPAARMLHSKHCELFKAKLISKWPGTTGYALHQDYTYWPGVERASPNDFITALLALDPADEGSGCVELFPRLHHSKLGPAANNSLDVNEAEVDLSTGFKANLQPGDIAFFHSMTPHRSGPNRSQRNRQSLFFTYVTPGQGELTSSYYSNRRADFMEP